MSDEKKYTEKDMTLAKREAFQTCACWLYIQPDVLQSQHPILDKATEKAREVYSLPPRRVPRIEPDPEPYVRYFGAWSGPREWRCVEGQLQSRTRGARIIAGQAVEYPWSAAVQIPPTAKRVALWADLLANPTVEVSDE